MPTRKTDCLAEAAATASAEEVLFSLDLWLELWRWLDRDNKAALRGVSFAMRGQVDGSNKVVASPACGFSPDVLSTALLLWPRVTHLTLLAVSDPADLAPLATAAPARLTSLTVREAPRAVAGEARPWDMLATTLSGGVAATLRVINISGCIELRSINVVRNCVQLRCLWMPGCVSVSDLSPLGACSETLEELWLACDIQVSSLAPLASFTKLRKLDLSGCLPALDAHVQDLQLACTQLAAPSSVELEGLVHELQASIPPGMQERAAFSVASIMRIGGLEAQAAVTAAGAIPALVRLLAPYQPASVQDAACGALQNLAANHAQNKTVVAAAGAILALVWLLGPQTSVVVQQAAARALANLAANHAQNKTSIAASGAIPALVRLLGPDSTAGVQEDAAITLSNLAGNHAQNKTAVAAAGAIPAVVLLLGPDSPAGLQQAVAFVLGHLAAKHAQNKANISAAGAIHWCTC
ncbi:hypothetical protein FOA52_013178 [Chlamydomonas sp. UWO 241]|nr:hypothetical protein FOA52_005123 [Chlamydomonas sp. UWO 241]KAG1673108.1 hypothetical protein FOA52_013178 [Chlamydomonas sp. UWO 241]